MSALDYLHGAGVQEIIDARRTQNEIADVTRAWEQTAEELWAEIHKRDQAIRDLTIKLRQTEAALEVTERNRAKEVEENFHLKAKASEDRIRKEHELDMLKTAYRALGDQVKSEARDMHDKVLDWICVYGDSKSHEFIQGVRQLIKQEMPMSQSESLRKRFMREFEAAAKAAAEANLATPQGNYYVPQLTLDKLANNVAGQLAREEKVRIKNAVRLEYNIQGTIGAGRYDKTEVGPEGIAAAAGKNIFLPPEGPQGSVGAPRAFLSEEVEQAGEEAKKAQRIRNQAKMAQSQNSNDQT